MRHLTLSFILAALAGTALAEAPVPTRGELLYNNHCGQCHSVQMHWRTLKRARDWDTLKEQVRRWQGEARLDWSEGDVEAVAHYLNTTIYQFPRPLAQLRRPAAPQSSATVSR